MFLETPVERVMSYETICLDVRTPLYRVAGHAMQMRVRRILAVLQPMRSRELALGFKPPASDAGLAHNGGDGRYDLFLDEPADTPYETYGPEQCPEEQDIVVVNPTGKLVPLRKISPLPDALNHQLMFRRLHILPAWKEIALRSIA